MEWTGLLDAGFLGDLVRIVIEVIMAIVGIILTPISALISVMMPDVDEALLKVPEVFAYANTYLGWLISALALPGILLTLVVGYYTFSVTMKLLVYPVKLALNWYRALKLGS